MAIGDDFEIDVVNCRIKLVRSPKTYTVAELYDYLDVEFSKEFDELEIDLRPKRPQTPML